MSCLILGLAMALGGSKIPAPNPVDISAEILMQKRMAEQFRQIEISILLLAQRLEKSKDPRDRAEAVRLKAVLKKSQDLDINGQFNSVIMELESKRIPK